MFNIKKTFLILIFFLSTCVLGQTRNSDFLTTYIGGNSVDDDYEPCIAYSPDGYVYITGTTSSSDFPVTDNAYDKTYNGNKDRFICKFDSELKTLLASTYIGGTGSELGMGISIDSEGNIYIAGYTTSANFPTTSAAFDKSFNGGSDVFIAKMDSDLTTLISSTYFGGTNYEVGDFPRIDITTVEGKVYVAGLTNSSNLPVSGSAYDKTYNQNQDLFVAKFDSDLSNLLAATYLGGNKDEWRPSLLVDSNGDVFVGGSTGGGIPVTLGAFDTSHNGGYYDAFVTKLSGDLSTLIASTYLGGNQMEDLMALRFDEEENLWVTGYTQSTNFPVTPGSYDNSFNGSNVTSDAYILKLSNDLSELLVSSFFGGDSQDKAEDIRIDEFGNVYIVGSTYSPNIPTTQNSFFSEYRSGEDAFFAIFDKDLTQLQGSSYISGASDERGQAIIFGADNYAYVAGRTKSSGLPNSTDGYDASYNGGSGDCFISKFDYSIFITGVEDEQLNNSPKEFTLLQNYPNPFNPSTTISFSLTDHSYVEVAVFDLLGRIVKTLATDEFTAGTHYISWDGRDALDHQVAGGVYFCRMTNGKKSEVIKMNLLK